MAEVRAIPSAVGAYEAQVIDMSRMYNQLLRNADAENKRVSALRKQVEDDLNTAISDKRLIRGQDDQYISGLRTELENYYSQNRDAIIRGGNEYNQLRKMMGNLTSEITRSVSAKEQGKDLQAMFLKASGTESSRAQISTLYTNAVATFQLPINDQRRKEYRFTNETGQEVGIEQLGVNELDRMYKFDETKLLNFVKENAPEYTITSQSYEKKTGRDIEIGHKYTNPYSLQNATIAMFQRYPDAMQYYKERSQLEQSANPNFQNIVNANLKRISKLYSDAGVTLSMDKEFGSVESMFTSIDGKSGVDVNNPLEYAVYNLLLQRLPQKVGFNYSYITQSNFRAAESLRAQQQSIALQRMEKNNTNLSLDKLLADDIRSGKFNSKDWTNIINTLGGQPETALGGIKPGEIEFKDNKMIVKTTKVLFDGQVPVTSMTLAEQLRDRTGKNGIIVQMPTGAYAVVESTAFDISDPATVETNVASGLNLIHSAQTNPVTLETWDELRKGNTKNLNEKLLRY